MESDILCFRSALFSASLRNVNCCGQQVAPFFFFFLLVSSFRIEPSRASATTQRSAEMCVGVDSNRDEH